MHDLSVGGHISAPPHRWCGAWLKQSRAMSWGTRNSGVAIGVLCLSLIGAMGEATAQTSPVSSNEQIAFDRPEAWAMNYFTSATTLNGLSLPDRLSAGSLTLQFESDWLPTLDGAQQRVGFNGTTPEDLNKAPVFLRPRVVVGLPRQLSIIAAVDPPIRSFEVTPRLLALGVDGVLHDAGAWRFGWRAHGQTGTVTAAVTCPANVVLFAPGSVNNPAGCNSESSDVTRLRYAGVELLAARHFGRRFAPHAAAGANLIDSVFQTNAQTFGKPDRTRLRAKGVTPAMSAGLGYAVMDRFSISADVFYAPLTVRRTATSASAIDPMINARVLFSYGVIR
jgi:hypothetical protein